jgi:hypothetical protein
MNTKVNITDRYLLTRLEELREKRGDKTATATASRLLIQALSCVDARGDFRAMPGVVVAGGHDDTHSGAAA